MDLYIFRHGETPQTKKFLGRLFGYARNSNNLPILPEGIPAITRLGEYLKKVPTDANFCSPYLRCRQTALIVGKISKKKFIPDKRLSELEVGGDRFVDFRKGVASFLKEIGEKNYNAVSICTHGSVIAAIKHLFFNNKFYFFQSQDYPNPGKLITIKAGKLEKINFNL